VVRAYQSAGDCTAM